VWLIEALPIMTSRDGGEGEPFPAEKLVFFIIIFIPWFSLYLRLNKQKLNPKWTSDPHQVICGQTPT
jgi:hypothetical protein